MCATDYNPIMVKDNVPLNIEGIDVPKYTVLLGKFHNNSLGISIGLRLEA